MAPSRVLRAFSGVWALSDSVLSQAPRHSASRAYTTSYLRASPSSCESTDGATHIQGTRLPCAPNRSHTTVATNLELGIPASDAAVHACPSHMASAIENSVADLLNKFKSKTGLKMEEVTSVLSKHDGAAVLQQRGVLRASGVSEVPEAVLGNISKALQEGAGTLSVQKATNVLGTMALLGFRNIPLKAAVVQRALPDLASAAPATIGSLCYVLGLGGYKDFRLFREMERVVKAQHSSYDIENFAKVVWMLGRAHHSSPSTAHLVDTLAQRALSPSSSLKDVVYAMWACGAHKSHLDELSEQALTLMPHGLARLSSGEVAKLAFGLLTADVREVHVYESMLAAMAHSMDTMCSKDLSQLVLGLGRAQVGGQSITAALAPHIMSRLDTFTYTELDMIVQAYNAWGTYDATQKAVADKMSSCTA